jgi:Zn finger protein HypA/HybF involved in hydrogenase expression
MIAQWHYGVMDRMRLTDRPEELLLSPFIYFISMRELPAIQSILVKALRKAQGSNRRIRRLQVAFGEISELDQTSIQKHWEEIRRGTPAEHAQLHFRSITAEVQCMACFRQYHPLGGKIHCPYCGSYGAKVLTGEEFYLESIEWIDDP